ncbi:hypothetical protein BHE74_00047634 [Ensete ventricosum]|nr:hypothetical protein GW17_00036132 [Ensete ventricosum]RWW46444.1 hypothetical protein BHE74_00047634 [Ensete ventricosum]
MRTPPHMRRGVLQSSRKHRCYDANFRELFDWIPSYAAKLIIFLASPSGDHRRESPQPLPVMASERIPMRRAPQPNRGGWALVLRPPTMHDEIDAPPGLRQKLKILLHHARCNTDCERIMSATNIPVRDSTIHGNVSAVLTGLRLLPSSY